MAIATANFVTTPVVNSGNGTLEDEFINGLVQGGSWVFSGPRDLTYSFNLNDDGAGGQGPGGQWVDSTQILIAVNAALAAWSNVANIHFQQVTSGTYYFESTADLAFTLTGNEIQTQVDPNAVALGIFPDRDFAAGLVELTEYPNPEGDVFLDNFHPTFTSVDIGSTGYWAILHEIGHALGLKHSSDDGANGRPTFSALGIAAYDSSRYTAMVTALSGPNVATPMLLDILAIQHIYGANTDYNTGNNTYALNTSYFSAIWDAGGFDTISATSWAGTDGVLIDLSEGSFSGARIGEKYTAIAHNATIEGAIGTAGHDMLLGNGAANSLDGGGGNDTLQGGAGADSVNGGANNDVIEGGDDADQLYGDDGNDTIYGGGGNDSLDGGAGVNVLNGGAGDDWYFIGAVQNIVELPGAGFDTVKADFHFALPDGFESLVLSGAGDVTATGNSAANKLTGNPGDNLLDGAGGADTMQGGGGRDVYIVDDPGDVVLENEGLDLERIVDLNGSQIDVRMRLGIADHGNQVVFSSDSTNLVSGDTNTFDVFVKDIVGGGIEKISTGLGGALANADSAYASISADGRYVVFQSLASNLVANDTNSFSDIFIKDRLTGSLSRISTDSSGTPGAGLSSNATISADGRFVVFESSSDLGFGHLGLGVYVKDLSTGGTEVIWTGITSTVADGRTKAPDISGDGRYVVFESFASDLVANDTNTSYDIFLYDRQLDVTTRVSTSSAGGQGNGGGRNPKISADGHFVVFENTSTNVLPGGFGTVNGVVRKNLLTGALEQVSVTQDGNENFVAFRADISSDGRYVSFVSGQNVYFKDMDTGALSLLSQPYDGSVGLSGAIFAAVSDHGRDVAMIGSANLLSGAADIQSDIYFSSVTSSGNAGIDVVHSDINYGLPQNVENLVVSGAGNVNGSGNSLNNILSGNSGNNILDGAAGADIIAGGPGNDTYLVDNSGDQVMELGSSGTDLIQSVVGYNLMQAWHVENLKLSGGSAINGSGNWQNNALTGNGATNVLDGSIGDDTLAGGGGSDTLLGGAGDDVLVWDAADGRVDGGAGLDRLVVSGGGTTIDLTAISNSLITDIEYIDITGSGNNTLALALTDVLALTPNTLRIFGDAGDLVNGGSGWTPGGTVSLPDGIFDVYTKSTAVVLVDSDLTRIFG